MRRKHIILMASSGILFSTGTALANNPPSGQTFLSMISILPLMIIFSMAGGAYVILKKLRSEQPGRGFLIGGVAVAILFSMVHEGFAAIVAAIFGIIAIGRGFQMIGWGLATMSRGQKPAHLIGASSWRLISSSICLITITVFLVGLSLVFTGNFIREYKYRDLEIALKNFVSYQIAYAQQQKKTTGRSRFDQAACDVYLKTYPRARVEYSPDDLHFTVIAPPDYLPVFPYNYMTAAPSYRADETGQIRMIRVRSKNHLCPANAPVIMKIDEQDLQQAWRTIFENQEKEQIDAHQAVGKSAREL